MEKSPFRGQWQFVRSRFFPRWDKPQQWKLRVGLLSAGYQGKCLSEQKEIAIDKRAEDVVLLLIHEICHAICPGYNHGAVWQRRMLKAAKRAREIGMLELARNLKEQVEDYRNQALRVTADLVYSDIRDSVLWGDGNSSFKALVRNIGEEYGFSPKELLKTYGRCRSVYEKAVRERERIEAMRSLGNIR